MISVQFRSPKSTSDTKTSINLELSAMDYPRTTKTSTTSACKAEIRTDVTVPYLPYKILYVRKNKFVIFNVQYLCNGCTEFYRVKLKMTADLSQR